MNEYTIDGILKREYKGFDNKEYWRVAREIWKHVCDHVKAEVNLTKSECKKNNVEAVNEKIKKLNDEIAALKTKNSGGQLTKEQVIAMIRESAEQGNAASQKILSDYIGLGKHEEDMVIEMVDFSNAPDWYKTKKPE